MQPRLILRVALYGMLAHLCIMPAMLILYTIILNVYPWEANPPFPWFTIGSQIVLNLALFVVVGLIVGRKAAEAAIPNAALAGVMLAVGILVLDGMVLMILPRHHPPPGRLVHPPAGFFASAFFTYWRVLEIAAATVGGWMAKYIRS